MSRSLVLCADDFGLSEGINRAILALIRQGRLSATSCMTTMPAWHAEAATELLALHGKAALGLHFNLTEGDHATPLGQLMQQSLSGRIDRQHIQQALETQLDRFEQQLGHAPDFVDGHQHIQMFPVIRQIVLTTLARRYGHNCPWIRVSTPALSGHDARFKALILNMMGVGFERMRRRYAIAGTRDFAGMYSLQPEAGFGTMMTHWFNTLPDGGLIMCHPGYTDGRSPLARAREEERNWLASAACANALQQHQRTLSKRPALL
ncbi:putative glycoside hydrolase/deacetylase ChbG (UPF0249 family) [Marinobacterium halophilum]|uniref:Putative glycoside hydrolase/deacetylase ChbG (UPF0249 family) n=1 Tax=Marinobacterium halophilum TaxID=267374 RepID=A0A2P8EWS2_9GAMM|nr:ChbG/HpnK family deacetylase [Marinobacterium halophilum]PSL13921.1 putative glycoside hydrolase/deacetylase ChbG (UPF0249 family) [Marinobacterium halophilum]